MDRIYAKPSVYWRQLQVIRTRYGSLDQVLEKITDQQWTERFKALSALTEQEVLQLDNQCERAVDLTLEIIQNVRDAT